VIGLGWSARAEPLIRTEPATARVQRAVSVPGPMTCLCEPWHADPTNRNLHRGERTIHHPLWVTLT
jgi:hypothetical protein